MSGSASANVSTNSHSTPTRGNLPFPASSSQSPSFSGRTATPSSSSNSLPPPSGPPTTPNQPTSVDALLAAYAGAPSPPLAALEQAVSDRNLLTSQNAQLWKLVEKQRSGYNQILKELERVRSERDSYRSRLHSLSGQNGESSSRRHKHSERQASAAASNSNLSGTSDNGSAPDNASNRQQMTRHHSDDHAPRRALQDQQREIHATRSQEPLSTQDQTLQGRSDQSSSSVEPSVTSTPQRPVLPPLLAPPRIASLHSPSVGRVAASQAPQEPVPLPRTTTSAPPLTAPTKSSRHQVPSSNFNPPSPVTVAPRHHTKTPSQSSLDARSPVTAPTTSLVGTRPLAPTRSTPLVQSYTEPTAGSPYELAPPVMPAARREPSRDSRISLPDEARHYITNMVDSPVVSPRVDTFARRAEPPAPVPTPSHPPRAPYEPADAPDSPPAELGYATQTPTDLQNNGPPLVTVIPASVNSRGAKNWATNVNPNSHGMFLDLEDDDTGAEGDDDEKDDDVDDAEDELEPDSQQSARPSRDDEYESENSASQQQPRSRNKPRAAPEDFPLPPSNPLSHMASHQAEDAASTFSAEAPTYRDDDSSSPPPFDTQTSPVYPQSSTSAFRALPLLGSDLPYTEVRVSQSSVRPNDRGKDVLSFIVEVLPGKGKESWRVEKLYSDVIALDQRVRASVGKSVGKKIGSLPEGKLWKEHAPAKVDQRKTALETYLQTLVRLPVKENNEIIAFFTSDIVRETKKPISQAGYKEGYLTKRGKNFGGWKSRFFVLQGPVLRYYESRGGAHLGSINVTGAQIGRQQRHGDRPPSTDEEKEYRHAFLIVEAKKGPGGNHPRHVLCAESDVERDDWVEMLVRYFSGSYSEDPVPMGYGDPSPSYQKDGPPAYQNGASAPPRSSTSSMGTYESLGPSSTSSAPTPRKPPRGVSRDEIIAKGPAIPLSQLTPDASNAKLFQTPSLTDDARAASPSRSMHDPSSADDRQAPSGTFSDAQTARRILERQQSSSLPDASPISGPFPNSAPSPVEAPAGSPGAGARANSEMGQYADIQERHAHGRRPHSPEAHRAREERKGHTSGLGAGAPPAGAAPERVPSPEKMDANGKVKISGPLNGAPIPSGFKFGGKDAPPDAAAAAAAANDRREKAKSRSFWGFGRPNGGSEKVPLPAVTYVPRAVFGVPLEESLDVAQIANLPAIVFRAIQYLQAKQADQEEGIYRLSGSSAVIKSLKDRFNMEGDVDLLASDEYWDPHAIAGLLKSFLRELPASILTRDLHLRFLAVIDFVDPQERIRELSQLIAALPLANYSLLRALTAHLILIVQNASVNKMTMRNVGIVFSPTLGIPAGVFSLMLGEFNRVFNVDVPGEEEPEAAADDADEGAAGRAPALSRRNSRQYSDAAADQLLGLAGRSLSAPAEEAQSDGETFSVHDESGAETTEDEAAESPGGESFEREERARRGASPETPTAKGRAADVAATRGLSIAISARGNRHSRIMGLPASPRPGAPSSGSALPSPMQTPRP